MTNHGKGKKGQQTTAHQGHEVPNPPNQPLIKIPDPLPVQIQSSTEENKRYAEEKDSRDATLRAARRLNWISLSGVIFALIGVIVAIGAC